MTNRYFLKFGLILLLAILSFTTIFFVYSALIANVSINSTGQILHSAQGDWRIGQYSNGTYYATNGITYINNADPTALINNAMVSGGHIYVEPGSYRLTGTLRPQSNVILNVSQSATIYQPPLTSLGASFALLSSSKSIQNFVLEGGIWDGNKGSLSDHRGTSTWNSNFMKYLGIAFYTGTHTNIVIKNLVLKNNVGQGIDLAGVTNGLVQNCTVLNSGDNPLTIEGSGGNCTVEYCTVIGGQDVGINTWQASNATLRYNTVINVTQYSSASHWGIAAEESSFVNIIGNTVSGCSQSIETQYSDNVVISQNIVIRGNPGIEVSNSDTVSIVGNDVTAVTGTKIRVSSSTNVYIGANIGYP